MAKNQNVLILFAPKRIFHKISFRAGLELFLKKDAMTCNEFIPTWNEVIPDWNEFISECIQIVVLQSRQIVL